MRELERAGLVESSNTPLSASRIRGVPSGSTKMDGDTFCRGSPTVSRPAAASIDNEKVFPLASKGTWICDAVVDAASTGTTVLALLAESTRVPRTLNSAPGAVGLEL